MVVFKYFFLKKKINNKVHEIEDWLFELVKWKFVLLSNCKGISYPFTVTEKGSSCFSFVFCFKDWFFIFLSVYSALRTVKRRSGPKYLHNFDFFHWLFIVLVLLFFAILCFVTVNKFKLICVLNKRKENIFFGKVWTLYCMLNKKHINIFLCACTFLGNQFYWISGILDKKITF